MKAWQQQCAAARQQQCVSCRNAGNVVESRVPQGERCLVVIWQASGRSCRCVVGSWVGGHGRANAAQRQQGQLTRGALRAQRRQLVNFAQGVLRQLSMCSCCCCCHVSCHYEASQRIFASSYQHCGIAAESLQNALHALHCYYNQQPHKLHNSPAAGQQCGFTCPPTLCRCCPQLWCGEAAPGCGAWWGTPAPHLWGWPA